MKPIVLVTGDIVLDCHLYGGVKTAATSFSEPGTIYTQQPGGAALCHRLLEAAADESGRAWDVAAGQWEKENAARAKRGQAPLPNDLAKDRPAPGFDTYLALDTSDLYHSLPEHLRSYGVWTDRPTYKGSNKRVWRVERHFGYGPTRTPTSASVFKPNPTRLDGQPVLALIDDGGLLFRHGAASEAWPALAGNAETRYLLKMSSPLCRGDLWTALAPVRDRLIVVVSAADLRREDVQITNRLSWERSAETTLCALQDDPIARELLGAAHVIVNFRSAGALWVRRDDDKKHTAKLVFDPVRLEDDFARDVEGTVYGFQTCLTTAIAHHLMARHAQPRTTAEGRANPGPFGSADAMDQALEAGIAAGLTAHRSLLELGHGAIDATEQPGFPTNAIGRVIAGKPGGFVSEAIPGGSGRPPDGWTILAQAELSGPERVPLTGVAELTARYGFGALSHVPALRLGQLMTVDRSEIESLRTVEGLVRDYEGTKIQKRPLSIGVFGPPGSGKSFGVKALAKAILGDKVPILEFNLSQFKGPGELIGAFHRVRDAVLGGVTPVAFWDEFDSQRYKWLQFLLAPMQDGAFQEGQVTHPIGKCIFIFAGGTSSTYQEFSVAPPTPLTPEARAGLTAAAHSDRKEEEDGFRDFTLLKGPDFVSRLHGFLNVLGPNPRIGSGQKDITWPVRRALVLRSVLNLKDTEELKIDPGLLHALLSVPVYHHGARSFEKVLSALAHGRENGRLHRAALPPDSALTLETDAAEFHRLMDQWSAFKNYPDIDTLAAAVHRRFLEGAEKSALEAEISDQPHVAWTIHPAVAKVYDQLTADSKAANRAAARRMPDHLALIGFVVVPQTPDDDGSWRKTLERAIEKHIERLAQAEHLGWCAERYGNGWVYHEKRDNALKHHHLLVDWARLSPADQEKDRHGARSIPGVLQVAGFKAVAVG